MFWCLGSFRVFFEVCGVIFWEVVVVVVVGMVILVRLSLWWM